MTAQLTAPSLKPQPVHTLTDFLRHIRQSQASRLDPGEKNGLFNSIGVKWAGVAQKYSLQTIYAIASTQHSEVMKGYTVSRQPLTKMSSRYAKDVRSYRQNKQPGPKPKWNEFTANSPVMDSLLSFQRILSQASHAIDRSEPSTEPKSSVCRSVVQ